MEVKFEPLLKLHDGFLWITEVPFEKKVGKVKKEASILCHAYWLYLSTDI